MRKIDFQYQPTPALEIMDRNGDYRTFELQVSDADLFDRALELAAKYRTLSRATPPRTVLKALKECTAVVDGILGEGAMVKLSCGKPLCIADALNLMAVITREGAAGYAERLGAYDE
ncbi:MAG: hypothetical protein GX418_04445 [Clostridiales bacterium]|nr:hypothetical protein [Clostridiales bacterium]